MVDQKLVPIVGATSSSSQLSIEDSFLEENASDGTATCPFPFHLPFQPLPGAVAAAAPFTAPVRGIGELLTLRSKVSTNQ